MTQPLSRRNWLGVISAASLGSGMLAATSKVAQSSAASPDNNLGARVYNIRDFGAKGDGATLDTAALQDAIDACNKDHGGIVLVPAGVFVIWNVGKKSNVTLALPAGGQKFGGARGEEKLTPGAGALPGGFFLLGGNVGGVFFVQNADKT